MTAIGTRIKALDHPFCSHIWLFAPAHSLKGQPKWLIFLWNKNKNKSPSVASRIRCLIQRTR
jgi:hypothetical protein